MLRRLIAIMLGRLEMSVDECIAAYNELSATVFAKPLHRLPVNYKGRVAPRFDSAKLTEAVLAITNSRGLPPDAPFNDGQDQGCKTYVGCRSPLSCLHSTDQTQLRVRRIQGCQRRLAIAKL